MNYLKKVLMVSAASLAVAGMSHADQQPLEERLAALESMVAELKAELAAERARSDADIVRIETQIAATPAAAPEAPTKKDGFMVGDTTVKVGGILDFDAHMTHLDSGAIASGSIARDFYIPGATPVGGDSTTFSDFTAESSRFFISAATPWGDSEVKAHLELDFLGSAQGNELVTNSYSPRLRRAYVTYGNWLAGQEWSTFQNTSAIPESASFLIPSDGMVFVRQPQIRYTNGNWQFALENSNTPTITSGDQDTNTLPDAVVRYNWKGAYGNVSLAGLGRQLRMEVPGIEEETFGYGLSLSGQLKVGERDDIRFNLAGGEGIGRYIGLAAGREAALSPTGDLEAIPSYGGLIAWRHPFGETARFNIGYSGLFIDNPSYVAGTATSSVQSAYAAVLWDVAPKVTLGVEAMHGIRELENGADGAISRFTFSTKYAF
ncbi:hypothetical protein K1X12_10780 [Hyphomonas sp. WL0036]|uniref:DcaP family trimeric outer membrane transporter n=1 Tax=Hyphomonas sediminis TaxID=2866160 RepID=UPI001C7F571A|nr:DcaP family trimeric outer membrane transporter [Hyphomonas sediminis]MBY9067387.1 hypothetical protein [Hyphomonas sediminis]